MLNDVLSSSISMHTSQIDMQEHSHVPDVANCREMRLAMTLHLQLHVVNKIIKRIFIAAIPFWGT